MVTRPTVEKEKDMKIKLYCICGKWVEYGGASREKIVEVFGDKIKAFRTAHDPSNSTLPGEEHKIFTTRKAANEEKQRRKNA